MRMFLEEFGHGVSVQDGDIVASLLNLFETGQNSKKQDGLQRFGDLRRESQRFVQDGLKQARTVGLSNEFGKFGVLHLTAFVNLESANQEKDQVQKAALFKDAFKYQVETFDTFLNIYRNEGSWLVPTLKQLVFDTRRLAVKTDKALGNRNGESLRETKRLLELCFRSANMGRATTVDSMKKREIALYLVNNQFKVFFGLKSLQLCRNLIRSVNNPTFPSMDTFPMSERVTYHFYYGRLLIFEDNLTEARKAFEYALLNCHPSRPRNVRLIYEFLVPINLFVGRIIKPQVLEKFNIGYLGGLVKSVQNGNIRQMEVEIEKNQQLYIARGLFLALETLKIVAYRNLFRNVVKIYQASASDPRNATRVSLDLFVRPFELYSEKNPLASLGESQQQQDQQLQREEMMEQIKCILSNLIYQRYLKGYISHEKEILVLSPKDPFPSLSTINN